MKVLLTGATGLIGTYLIKELLSKGYAIHFLTTQKSKLNSIPNSTGFLWDVQNQTIDVNCLTSVTTIIHLAGANIGKRWTKSYKKEIIESRVQGATILHQLLRNNKHQVQHFVSASAVGIYQNSLTELHTEKSKHLGNGFLKTVTEQWEEATNCFQELGLSVAKLRTGVVLASNDGALQQMMKPIQMGFGSALGSGKQQMSWIHITDLVRLYAYVLDKKISGVFNAVAPEVVSNTVFTNTLAEQLQTKIRLPNVPTFVLRMILGEMHLLLCESQKVSSNKIQKAGFQFQYSTLSEALANLLPR